jgi:class 3 adenylate cyclase
VETDAALPSGRTRDSASSILVFLFAEVRDFTRFSQDRGDEAALRLVERFTALAREVLEARGGKVIELRGDEALAVFGTARQALRAAVELQSRYAEENERDRSIPMRVGLGMDAGEAVPFEGGFRGRALNLAARLKDQARAGQVLATEALIHLAGNTQGLVYIERGMVQPKGFTVPVHIVEVAVDGRHDHETDPFDEPELRTFLFADIQGWASFTSGHGDRAGMEMQSWYERFVEERVRAHGGRVVEIIGDSAFAVFVSARHAILAGMDMEEQFRRVIAEEQGLPLLLNLGIETGEAIPFRGKYTGNVVNLAARICNRARGGQILVGETARQLVRRMDALEFSEWGQVQIADQVEPVQVARIRRRPGCG